MGQLMRFARLSSALGAFLLVASCGGSRGGDTLRGVEPGDSVTAPTDGAHEYRTAPSAGGGLGEDEAAVSAARASIEQAGTQRGITLAPDGRLALLAAWTAEQLGNGGALPPPEVTDFFASHLGLVEAAPHLLLLGNPSAEALAAGLVDSVGTFLERQPYSSYGVAIVRRQSVLVAVVALSGRWLELEPVAREQSAGATIRLRGRLASGYMQPVLLVETPTGPSERRSLGEGAAIDAQVPTSAPGTYRIEILATGPSGMTVVANFPVYVGTPAPRSVVIGGVEEDDPGEARDAGTVTRTLLALINRSRAASGVAPVESTDALADIALAHTNDMVAHGFVGHRSPTAGEPHERVARAGLSTGLVLENVGRGYGAAEIHRGMMASPGHRANVLNPDVTHVGIGVVVVPEADRTAFVATEVFVFMAREVDPAASADRLLGLLNQGRAARRAGPLERDPNLDEAAAQAAREFFADPSMTQQDTVDRASGSMRRFAIAFSRIGGLMAVVTHLEDAARLEPAFDPDLRYVGIGIAQGSRPDTPANAIAVVILIAWPR